MKRLFGLGCRRRALLGERPCRHRRPVPGHDLVSGAKNVRGDVAAHGTQADESDFHVVLRRWRGMTYMHERRIVKGFAGSMTVLYIQ